MNSSVNAMRSCEAQVVSYPAIAAASAADGAGTSSNRDAVLSSSIAAASNARRAITPYE